MTRDRFEILMRLRRIREDQAQVALGRAMAEESDAAALRDARAQRLARERSHHAQLGLESPAPAWQFVVAEAALEAAERVLVMAESHLTSASERVGTVRAELAQATRQREAVERLQGRIRLSARLAAARREDRELNEIAIGARARRAIEAAQVEGMSVEAAR